MLESKQIISYTSVKSLTYMIIKIAFTLVLVSCIGSGLNAQVIPLRLNKSVTNTTPNVGDSFDYIIQASCNNTVGDCETTVITDCLPPEVEYINVSNPLPDGVSSAVYNPLTHCVEIRFDATACATCSPDGINTDNDDFAQGSTIQLAIRVRFPNGTIDGTTADNTATATTVNAGNPSDSAPTVTAQNGATSQTGCNQLFADTDLSSEVIAGGNLWIRNRINHLGTSNILNYTISTAIPSNTTFDYIQVPDWPANNHTGTLYYQRSDQPAGTWVSWTTFNTSTNGNDRYYVASLSLPPGVTVTDVRLELGTLSGDGSWNIQSAGVSTWESSFRVYTNTDPAVPVGTIISTCSQYSGTIDGIACSFNECDSSTVVGGSPNLTGGKSIVDPITEDDKYTFNPGDTYMVELQYASDEANNTDILGAVMVDVLPPGMTYVPGSWYFDFGDDNIQFQQPDVQTGYLVDGRQYVRFVWDNSLANEFTLAPIGSWYGFQINFEVLIGTGVATGTYTNEYYYTATGSNHGCEDGSVTDPNNYAGGYGFDSDLCDWDRDLEVIRPPGSAGLESYKEVKGSLNTNYNRYPNYGTTVPGGNNDYLINVTNPNSTPVTDIVIIDIFPYIGDTEVLNSGAPRSTEWRPNLLEPIPTPPGGTVYYTTVTNPCRDELAGPSDPTPFPSGCTNPNWSTTPPSDITTVTGFKIDLGNRSLNQGQEFELEWEMRAPVDAPTSGEIAWNSFAYIASNATSGTPLLPAEPIKVGIESFPGSVPFHGDFVWNDLNGNGLQDAGEPGIDGVTVTMYRDNGDGIPNPANDTEVRTTVTGNGGLFLFSDFLLGNYFLEFTNLPAGFNPTHTNVGGNNAIDSDGLITPVTNFGSTTDNRTCDLGLYFGIPPTLCVVDPTVPDDWNYGCGDNTFVEILGIGINNNLPATINIPNPGDVVSIIAEAVFANGLNDCVEFSTSLETISVAGEQLIDEGCPRGVSYRAELQPANSVTVDADIANDAESFILYVFRQGPSYTNGFSQGNRVSACIYQNTVCETFTIPTQVSDRDINVTIPISQLSNSSSVVQVNLNACGVTSTTTINSVNAGNSLYLAEITLDDVPGSCSSFEVCLDSPVSGGQPMYMSGMFAIDAQCCDLLVDITNGDNEICYGEEVRLTTNVINANGSVTYEWSTGETSDAIDASPLTTTIYTVTVTDALGCESINAITVTVNPVPRIEFDALENETCFGDSDGSVLISATKGQSPYTYIVGGQGTNTSGVFNNLSQGYYNLTVTDNRGCVTEGNFSIGGPIKPLMCVQDSCVRDITGAWVGENKGPHWDGPSGNNNVRFEMSLGPGTYLNYSETNETLTTANPDWFTENAAGNPSLRVEFAWDTFPEDELTNIDLPGDDKGMATFTLTFSQPVSDVVLHVDRLGSQGGVSIDQGLTNSSEWFVTTPGVTMQKLSGTSDFTVTPNAFFRSTNRLSLSINKEARENTYDGSAAGSIGIASSTPVTSISFEVTGIGVEGFGFDDIELAVSSTVCAGITPNNPTNVGCDCTPARASMSACGGTPPYMYNWSNGATGPDIDNLEVGVYYVTITDSNGCEEVCDIEVIEEPGCCRTIFTNGFTRTNSSMNRDD